MTPYRYVLKDLRMNDLIQFKSYVEEKDREDLLINFGRTVIHPFLFNDGCTELNLNASIPMILGKIEDIDSGVAENEIRTLIALGL